ncbi:MAG: hypothetical protein NTV73_00965 [Hyphomicrobiales bacterium]|nr:hypothetical protein [Hyphomicrobiales bacterium]
MAIQPNAGLAKCLINPARAPQRKRLRAPQTILKIKYLYGRRAITAAVGMLAGQRVFHANCTQTVQFTRHSNPPANPPSARDVPIAIDTGCH